METPWYNRKWFGTALHIIVWLFVFSVPFLLQGPGDGKKPKPDWMQHPYFMISYIFRNLLWIGLFYFNAKLLVPKYLYPKKNSYFMLAHLITFFLIVIVFYFVQRAMYPQEMFSWRAHIVFNLLFYLFFFFSSTMFQLIADRAENDKLNKEKETENLKTELSLLRSQVSPHFMFNVLNNMVALARKKSDVLEPSLIKLSSLMRYMLYEADEDKVQLEKEVEYLQSYIDLQKQRFGKNVQVNVIVHPFDDQYEIEPMLLIPFVENAFKHGTGMIENAEINIDLKAMNQILQFNVRNKYDPESQEVRDKSSGIGLANVKRRLNLLYAKNHEISISGKDAYFTVELKIKLN
jgi:two-component system, LytTR family, sensor kinase